MRSLLLRPCSPARASGLRRSRRGAAAVEFAFIAPLLALLVTGMFELGRGLMVKEVLSDAAQKACRTAALPGKSNADVQSEVDNIMADNGVTGYTVTVLVNGAAGDVSTAQRFDKVSVLVSVPVANVTWTTTFFLTASMLESQTVVMMRQG